MKKKDWTGYLLELLVVIIGVTIAFGLNNWREGSKQDDLEELYLQSLQNDLAQDAAMLADWKDRQEATIARIGQLIAMKTSGRVVEDSLSACFRAMNYSLAFVPTSSTFRSMESSGNLSIISDFEMRKALTTYYEIYCPSLAQMDMAYEKHTAQFSAPFFMEHARYSPMGKLDPSIMEGPYVSNIIFSQFYLARSRLDVYQRTQTACGELLEKLQAANE